MFPVRPWSLLVLYLIAIPTFVTWLHLHDAILPTSRDNISTNLCWVRRQDHHDDHMNGLYEYSTTTLSFVKKPQQPPIISKWPSIVDTANTLARATRAHYSLVDQQAQIVRHDNNATWCLQNKGLDMACLQDSSGNHMDMPSSGMYSTTNPQEQFQVYCFGQAKSSSSTTTTSMTRVDRNTLDATILKGVRKNPNKHSVPKQHASLQFLRTRPATCILLVLNIGLALLYWNFHVAPSSVAKIYSKLVVEYELWRSFSSATAHFEPLHLGFNMMSLYSLGNELESTKWSSVEFLFYNISIIPWTTMVFLSLIKIQRKFSRNVQDTSTVGYSGVLFAFIVVTSLERQVTCPIPFLPDTCFTTWSVKGFKFNASPLVQLVMAQVIMKRVSFLGHLAGIVVGFGVHWNLLPLEYMQPCMLIPMVLIWHYAFVRKPPLLDFFTILPWRRSQGEQDGIVTTTTMTRGSGNNDEDVLFYSTLVHVRNVMMVVLLLSTWIFGIASSITLSFLLVWILYGGTVKSHGVWLKLLKDFHPTANNKHQQEAMQHNMILCRGFVVCCIILVIVDSMTLAGWIVMWSIGSSRGVVVFWHSTSMWTCLLLIWSCRILSQLLALCLIVKHIYDVDETGGGGIFVGVFGWTVLDNANVLGNTMIQIQCQHRPVAGPFEGRGIVLGGRRNHGDSTGREGNHHQDEQMSHLL